MKPPLLPDLSWIDLTDVGCRRNRGSETAVPSDAREFGADAAWRLRNGRCGLGRLELGNGRLGEMRRRDHP